MAFIFHQDSRFCRERPLYYRKHIITDEGTKGEVDRKILWGEIWKERIRTTDTMAQITVTLDAHQVSGDSTTELERLFHV